MDTHEQRHEMLQNVNSCGEGLTPSLKVTMLNCVETAIPDIKTGGRMIF